MKNLLYKVLFSIVILVNAFNGIAQNEVEVSLKWSDAPGEMLTGAETFLYPQLENSFVSENEFLFLKEFNRSIANSHMKLDLLTYQTSGIDQVTKNFLETFSFDIQDGFDFELKNNAKAGKPTAVLSFVPFIKVNGEIRKITSVSFKQTWNSVYKTKASTFASASALQSGSGDWYKISVKNDGIHKIDYNFLKSIGINIDNVNPDHINIYGNSFGRLPELNSDFRPDDLLKNDIVIVGDGDGSFDAGDYILFYGKGPHKWEEKNGSFERNLNIYSNYSAYYINISSTNTPARIHDAVSTSLPSTHIVTSYDSYTIHEQELKNIMKSGQRWYGEEFDANLTQTFSMNIPNLEVNEPAMIRGFMLSKQGGMNGIVNFKVSYGNTELGIVKMGGISKDSHSRNGFSSAPGIFNPTSSTFSIKVQFNRITPSNFGYLDFLEVNARSNMKYYNGMTFRDLNSVGVGYAKHLEIP